MLSERRHLAQVVVLLLVLLVVLPLPLSTPQCLRLYPCLPVTPLRLESTRDLS